MAKAKPQIEIVSIQRLRKKIAIAWTQGEGSFDLCEPENPLPSFWTAWEALVPLVATICHFPAKYVEEGVRISSITIGTKGGAETVVFDVRKDLDDSSKEFKFKTPERLMRKPTEEGSYSPPLTEEQGGLVYDMLEEAKKYVKEERAQGVLPILGTSDDAEEEEDPNQGKLDVTGAQDPKPKRGRKPKLEPAAAE